MTEIIDLLERAKKEHNDDCILCAVKDTAIELALGLLKQQPPAGEFTKEARKTAENIYSNNPNVWPSKPCLSSYIKEACDRLDRVEVINADLLTACKHFYSEFSDYGRICNPNSIVAWHHDQKYKNQLLVELEAAIANATKG